MAYTFPDSPHLMEPLLPAVDEDLERACYDLSITSAEFAASLHPMTAQEVGKMVSNMNCYYSNLIEGHDTKPVDIERALNDDYSAVPEKRILQLEARAHVEVERQYLSEIEPDTPASPFSAELLQRVHKDFYSKLPEELHWVQSSSGNRRIRLIPGEIRRENVQVGQHFPPDHAALSRFLRRMDESCQLEWMQKKLPFQKIPLIAAAHHRLLWVHPFLDGNGRVVRLISVLTMRAAGIKGVGLWSPARGLAKRVKNYKELLEAADAQRHGSHDGRGELSLSALTNFCKFYIDVCNDQVQFMGQMLELERLEKRVKHFFGIAHADRKLRQEGAALVIEALRRGEFPRGEAERILGLGERTARVILGQLLAVGLLKSDTTKGPVRAAFPAFVAGFYFPNLFPAGSAEDIPEPRNT